jgi:hypothetical protein
MFNTATAPMSNRVRQAQTEVNKVYKTTDLSIFKTIEGNRVPNLQHVKRLSDSIRVYGMKCNPILVNENMEVIDGQHRLFAAKETQSFVYYIIVSGYKLDDVHTLNLNQKNWGKKDFMEGYASIGIKDYIMIKKFTEKNDDFGLNDCIALCSNNSVNSGTTNNGQKPFENGYWKCKDLEIAQEWANKLRMLKPYYSGYNRSGFVGTMAMLFKHELFDFSEFMHKVRLQPTALVDCANRDQYKTLIEDIYNYKSRNKISLRY